MNAGDAERTGPQVPLVLLIEGLADAVLVADERGEIVLVNAKAEESFGLGRDDLVGRRVEVLLSEGPHDVQLGRRGDGNEFPVEIARTDLQTDEGVLVAMVITDIAQRRRLEAFGGVVGGIAHDFNNLLTAIMGYAGFLLRDLDEGSKAHRDALEIRTAAQRGAALTRQLLDVSQTE